MTPLKEYICITATKGDVFLIQCYFGGYYEMINYVKSLGFNAFHSTTKRNVVEKEIDSKIVKTSVFEHIIFRKF